LNPKSAVPPIPNEAEHIAQARNGDKDAYRILFEAYKDRLFGLVLSMVRHQEQAEDLTQEIFVKAYFALPSFAGDSAFYTWLFRIGSNHCLDYLRKRKLPEISLDDTTDEDETISRVQNLEAPAAEHPDAQVEGESEVLKVLDSLDPDQRMVLSLREVEGYSYEEMGRILKCGVNTIKSRLNRAREAFKAVYLKEFGPPHGRAGRPPESVADGNILKAKLVEKSEGKR
jgi:RNA polymerase sigma-70 factor (ECF subfamily)